MRRRGMIYLIISLLMTVLLACRAVDFVSMMAATATRTARPTFTPTVSPDPTTTSTIVSPIIPTPSQKGSWFCAAGWFCLPRVVQRIVFRNDLLGRH